MIGKLTGTIDAAGADGSLVVDVGGVGYAVRVPPTMLPALAGRVSLYIHTAVRDDAIDLYGFPTEADLAFFKLLMSVSGVGPKTALSIMGVADAGSLKRAIGLGDAATLTKVFGLGKKSAERLVVELRDKVAYTPGTTGGDREVLEALVGLGYSAAEARQALKTLSDTEGGVKERLSAALKALGAPARV